MRAIDEIGCEWLWTRAYESGQKGNAYAESAKKDGIVPASMASSAYRNIKRFFLLFNAKLLLVIRSGESKCLASIDIDC